MAKLGKSQREKDLTTVVSVAAFRDGKLLMGLRGDSGAWNCPGGHVEPGEGIEAAARRELKEETGLDATRLIPLGFCDVKEGLRVYSFVCKVSGEPTAKDDPDEEIVAFKWLDPEKMPKSVMSNLHNKKDVTLQFLKLQDRGLDLIWDEEAPRKGEVAELRKEEGEPGETECPGCGGLVPPQSTVNDTALESTDSSKRLHAVTAHANLLYTPTISKLMDDPVPEIKHHAINAAVNLLSNPEHLQSSSVWSLLSHDAIQHEHAAKVVQAILPHVKEIGGWIVGRMIRAMDDREQPLHDAAFPLALKTIENNTHEDGNPAFRITVQNGRDPEALRGVLQRGGAALRYFTDHSDPEVARAAIAKIIDPNDPASVEAFRRTETGALSMNARRELIMSPHITDPQMEQIFNEIETSSGENPSKVKHDLASMALHAHHLPAHFYQKYVVDDQGESPTSDQQRVLTRTLLDRSDAPEDLVNEYALKTSEQPSMLLGFSYPNLLTHDKLTPQTVEKIVDWVTDHPQVHKSYTVRDFVLGTAFLGSENAIVKVMDPAWRGISISDKATLARQLKDPSPQVRSVLYNHPDDGVRSAAYLASLKNAPEGDQIRGLIDPDVNAQHAALDTLRTHLGSRGADDGSGESKFDSLVRQAIRQLPDKKPETGDIHNQLLRAASPNVLRDVFENSSNVDARRHVARAMIERTSIGDAADKHGAEFLNRVATDSDEGVRAEALTTRAPSATIKAVLPTIKDGALASKVFTLSSDRVTPEDIAYAVDRIKDQIKAPENPGQAADNSHIYNLEGLVRSPHATSEALDWAIAHGDEDVAERAIGNRNISTDRLRDIAGGNVPLHLMGSRYLIPKAKKVLAILDPDTAFDERVSVSLGTNKLRKIRDLVTAADKPQHKNNFRQFGIDLTPYTKPGTAIVDPEKLQSAIEKQDKVHYNVSHDVWEGAQRHNEQDSKVFQLNLSTELVNKLKAAGVYDTFKDMQSVSHQSAHPIHEQHGIGWIRYNQASDPVGSAKKECSTCEGRGLRTFTGPEDCQDCDGTGNETGDCSTCGGSGTETDKCGTCGGEGELQTEGEDGQHTMAPCADCEGSGTIGSECSNCSGTGNESVSCESCGGEGSIETEQEDDCEDCGGSGKIDLPTSEIDPDKDQFFIDEVQSDFGQDFGKVLSTNTHAEIESRADARGLVGDARQRWVNQRIAEADEELKKFPPEKTKLINEILFNNKHSNEILYESFLQYLRDKGHAGSEMRVHSVDSKAPISLGRKGTKWVDPKTNQRVDLNENGYPMRSLDEETKRTWAAKGYKEVPDVPAHFINTYEKIPTKVLGWEPHKYGELGMEDGDVRAGAPTWGDKLRKSFSIDDAPSFDQFVIVAKASKTWKSKDGISIPATGTPERMLWDENYHGALVNAFGAGNPNALRPVKINPADPGITGSNMAVNKDRLNLYRRMARGGDRLPPVVVRRSGQGWVLVDGNHRQQAALDAKLPELEAYEIVPLKAPPAQMKKDEKKPSEPAFQPQEIPQLRPRPMPAHETPEFKAWFGKSKTWSRSKGKPMVFYRGTRRGGNIGGHLNTLSFAEHPDIASIYAGTPSTATYGQGANVFPVHLKMENPLNLQGHQSSFGDLLRTLRYGKDGGIEHEDAIKILNHLINRKRAINFPAWSAPPKLKTLQQLGDFNYRVINSHGKEESPDLGDLLHGRSQLHGIREDFDLASDPDEALEHADRLYADTYAYVDTPAFTRAAQAQGYDGVIHDDVMQAAPEVAPKLVGKDPSDMDGMEEKFADHDNDLSSEPDWTHKTYRPFGIHQVKSIHNIGTWSSADPDITKSEDLQKMAQLDYNTPEFQQWFNGSHVKHPDGRPMRVFHGTSKDREFESFNTPIHGAWFAEDPDHASSYAVNNDAQGHKYDHRGHMVRTNSDKPRIIPVHLAIKNPMDPDDDQLESLRVATNYRLAQRKLFSAARARGHDGIKFPGGVWVAFHPHQIKSIFNNQPTEHKNVLKSEQDPVIAIEEAANPQLKHDREVGEWLQKMAIKDLKPGEKVSQLGEGGGYGAEFDYSHLLPPDARAQGMTLALDHCIPQRDNFPHSLRAYVRNASGQPMGSVTGAVYGTHTLAIHEANMHQPGRGLGTAAYEALMAHAHHKLGATAVVGDDHSTSAHFTHRKLAQKHGMEYKARLNMRGRSSLIRPGPYDGRYGPYRYTIKGELEKMSRPTPTFPKLGLGDDRKETEIVTTPRQYKIKERSMINGIASDTNGLMDPAHATYRPGVTRKPLKMPNAMFVEPLHPDGRAKTTEEIHQEALNRWKTNHENDRLDWVNERVTHDMDQATPGVAPVFGASNAAMSLGQNVRDAVGINKTGAKGPWATQLHENFHLMMKRVEEKYGSGARKALAQNILNHIKVHDPEAHTNLKAFIRGKTAMPPQLPGFEEEHLAHLLNFVNNPAERNRFFEYMKWDKGEKEASHARRFTDSMKRAYALFANASGGATERWLMPPSEKSAADWQDIENAAKSEPDYGEDLQKSIPWSEFTGQLARFGWTNQVMGAKHHEISNPQFNIPGPRIQNMHWGRNIENHHVAKYAKQIGLKLNPDGTMEVDPKDSAKPQHDYRSHYKRLGVWKDPEAQQINSWTPGVPHKHIPLDQVDVPEGTEDWKIDKFQGLLTGPNAHKVGPIKVQQQPNGRYSVVHGANRLGAAYLLGHSHIPVEP